MDRFFWTRLDSSLSTLKAWSAVEARRASGKGMRRVLSCYAPHRQHLRQYVDRKDNELKCDAMNNAMYAMRPDIIRKRNIVVLIGYIQ